MKIRQLKEGDELIISEWLVDQPWNLPPIKDGMSKFGYIVSDDVGDLVSCYVYMTQTGYAFAEWFGMNPSRDFEDHKIGMKELLERIEGFFKSVDMSPKVGCLTIYTKINWMADMLSKNDWKNKKNFHQLTRIMK